MKLSGIYTVLLWVMLSFQVKAQQEEPAGEGRKKTEMKELPEKAKSFIRENFTREKAQLIIRQAGSLLDEGYDVVFGSRIRIRFDRKGEWKKIDGNRKPIPTSFIPEKILQYINKSFPNNYVVKIERERKGFGVEISNGLDLEFDHDGNFLKIDG